MGRLVQWAGFVQRIGVVQRRQIHGPRPGR